MLSLTEILRRYSVRHHNKMKVLTRPLKDHFGIHYFHFHQVKNDGRFFFITNQMDLNEIFFSYPEALKNNPYTASPEFVKEGYSDWDPQNFPGKKDISRLMKTQLNIDRNIKLILKNDDGYSLGSFGFVNSNPHLLSLIGKDSHLLQRYLTYFLDEITPILKKGEDDAADLHAIMGGNFSNPHYRLSDFSIKKRQFLCALERGNAETVAAPTFTERELECLGCCLEGLTAAQIGNKLFLSKRTIEHRIEQIKAKLGCRKKSDIISSVHHLEHQGRIAF